MCLSQMTEKNNRNIQQRQHDHDPSAKQNCLAKKPLNLPKIVQPLGQVAHSNSSLADLRNFARKMTLFSKRMHLWAQEMRHRLGLTFKDVPRLLHGYLEGRNLQRLKKTQCSACQLETSTCQRNSAVSFWRLRISFPSQPCRKLRWHIRLLVHRSWRNFKHVEISTRNRLRVSVLYKMSNILKMNV